MVNVQIEQNVVYLHRPHKSHKIPMSENMSASILKVVALLRVLH